MPTHAKRLTSGLTKLTLVQSAFSEVHGNVSAVHVQCKNYYNCQQLIEAAIAAVGVNLRVSDYTVHVHVF